MVQTRSRTHLSSPSIIETKSAALDGYVFVLSGDFSGKELSSSKVQQLTSFKEYVNHSTIEEFIKLHKGKVVKKLDNSTTHLLASVDDIRLELGKFKEIQQAFPQIEVIDLDTLASLVEEDSLDHFLSSSLKLKKRKSDATTTGENNMNLSKNRRTDSYLFIPLDPHVPSLYKDFQVLTDKTRIWHALLNCTDITNNSNKFYIIQLSVSPRKDSYLVFLRWGRVGESGNSDRRVFSDVRSAKEFFLKKYSAKSNKYTELDPHFEEYKEIINSKASNFPSSKLHHSVQELVSLIFDLPLLYSQMKSLDYDLNKLPLGKLKDTTIFQGYSVLQKLSEAIERNEKREELRNLSSQFYTLIPHAFGRRTPPAIDSLEQIDHKVKLLESLNDAMIANNLQEEAKRKVEEHPIDALFETLKIDYLLPLDRDSDDFKLIQAYIQTSHGISHFIQLELLECFHLRRTVESNRFQRRGHHRKHNRMLLWHGSRLMNFVGILSRGLRIAPPEAPVNGYMFGKGVYFADTVSKSAMYCASSASNNIGLMLLCEVAVGDSLELINEDYTAGEKVKLLKKHSTKGLGQYHPDPNQFSTLSDGTLVPIGTHLIDESKYLLYNEYIVYDVSQIKIRYLLKFRISK